VGIGNLEEDYSSEGASPNLQLLRKRDDKKNEFVTNFREVNLLLKCHPFSLSKIGEMILSLEGFIFAEVLDLNMGNYYIKLDAKTQKLVRHNGMHKHSVPLYSFYTL
jgi:hypothetical protein